MNKKKFFAVILACVMTFSLVACGDSKKETTEKATTDDMATEEAMASGDGAAVTDYSGKTLKVGTNIGYPPFEYYDIDGTTPIGVDMELAYAIGEELGFADVELIDTAWDGIFAGLQKGDYDCIISAVTINPERLLDFSFSEPYIQNWQSIVTLKDSEVKPANVAELDGLKIAYQEETSSDFYVTDFQDKNNLEFETYEYAQVMDCFTELEVGRIDAVFVDSTVASSYVSDPESKFEVTWSQDSMEGEIPEEFAVCIRQDDEQLCNDITSAIKTLKENGKLDEILNKYF